MSDSTCNAEEAVKALGYLRRSFGGFGIPDDEERSFLRLFRNYTSRQIAAAIDDLVRISERRPSPNDVAQTIRKQLPQRPDDTEHWYDIQPSPMPEGFKEQYLAGKER